MPDPAFTEHRRFELLGSDTNFAAVQGTAPAGGAEGSANWGSDPKNSQTIGSPFFSLGFFGDAKKSKSPAGARPGLFEASQAFKLARPWTPDQLRDDSRTGFTSQSSGPTAGRGN